MKATDFDVMGVMSARNLDIRMSDQILRLNKVRQGTQIVVGMGGDVVAAVANGTLCGGLYLMDNAQFEAVREELEAAPEPPTVAERDSLLAILRAVEWKGSRIESDGVMDELQWACPSCERPAPQVGGVMAGLHAPDCPLAAAIGGRR